MATVYEKTCALCGQPFITKARNAKYCSDCRYKGNILKMQ